MKKRKSSDYTRILTCPKCSTFPVLDGLNVKCPHCGFYVMINPKSGFSEEKQWNKAVAEYELNANKKHTVKSGLSPAQARKRNGYRPDKFSPDRIDETEQYNGWGPPCSERQSRQRLGFDDCSTQRSERTYLDKYLDE